MSRSLMMIDTHDEWNKRPDGIVFKIPTKTKAGVICLLEFKRMSDVTNQYIIRTKRVAEEQYTSLRSVLTITIQRQGWKVEQVNFILGARSLNEEELKKNLACFKVPPTSVVTGLNKNLMRLRHPWTLRD